MFKNFNRAHLPLRIRDPISSAVRAKPRLPSRICCDHQRSQTQNPKGIQRLRRSAMSIAADAPGFSSSSIGAACFFDRSWRASFRFLASIVTMNLINLRIPKGFRLKAQGWRACEPTLGSKRRKILNPNGVAPIGDRSVHGKLQHLRIAHWNHEPQTENPKGIPSQSPGLPSLRGYPGIEASEFHNPNGVAPNRAPSVHGELLFASPMHCDLEPRDSSPSPPPEERAGERRLFGISLLEFFWDLELGIWSFPQSLRWLATVKHLYLSRRT
jgi:hypothetical protein